MPGRNGVRRSQQEGLRSASIGGGRGVLGGVWGKAASRAGEATRGWAPEVERERPPVSGQPARAMPEEACRAPPYRAATGPLETGATGEGGSSSQAAETGQRGCSGVVPCRAGVDSWREQVPGGRSWGALQSLGCRTRRLLRRSALGVIPSPWFSCHPPIQTDFYQTFFLNAIFHSLAF